MSSVSAYMLPIVVPFFGAAVLIGMSTTCCLWRRAQRNYYALVERVAALESRAATVAAPAQVPTYVPVYTAPQQYRMNYYPPAYPPGIVPSAPPSANL